MQLRSLTPIWDKLQIEYGDKEFNAIYGCGEIDHPKLMLVFMNPTARNVSSKKSWKGIRAPWLGTKAVWRMLYKLDLFKETSLIEQIESMKADEWDEEFSEMLYQHIKDQSIYITNIAKCTLSDARAVRNSVYKDYLSSMYAEIKSTNPSKVITFGNQVSSVLLGKNLSVSDYLTDEKEVLGYQSSSYSVYPTYYPVGQGRRNMQKAKDRILKII